MKPAIKNISDSLEVAIIKLPKWLYENMIREGLFNVEMHELIRIGPNKESFDDEQHKQALSDYIRAKRKLEEITFKLKNK